jgi:hypothetical protein
MRIFLVFIQVTSSRCLLVHHLGSTSGDVAAELGGVAALPLILYGFRYDEEGVPHFVLLTHPLDPLSRGLA